MTFAKNLNRTLVVPGFRTYKNVAFNEWFQLSELAKYHRVISGETFMSQLSPQVWRPEERTGFCWLPQNEKNRQCDMKFGNPGTNFWDELGVDRFTKSEIFDFTYHEIDKWKNNYPPQKYPVIALKGAPATYPILKSDRSNQKYLKWSKEIDKQVDDIINENFRNEKFIGIHLRNGQDWVNACEHGIGNSIIIIEKNVFLI
jgi:peptide-O-fucosyltransferase